MNYKIYQRKLSQLTMSSIVNLSLIKQDYANKGIVYTLYRELDNTLKVGYTFHRNKLEKVCKESGFCIIGNRVGTYREKYLLEITLKELGYQTKPDGHVYEFSTKLIRHLETLGWPVKASLDFFKNSYNY